MEFKVKERHIECTNDTLIGDNADYVASFSFDEEWDGKIKTARFIQKGKYKDKILKNDSCNIPVELLKEGFLSVGVFSAEMTTTYCKKYILPSIKESGGIPVAPTDDVYAQIISMIENMETGGASEEQIFKVVEEYLVENPIETASDNIACKIIAHRGYHTRYPQNTIAAFKDAIENGFSWLEIDIRKCTDGFYVMSHDDAVTLYNNGIATSVTISQSKYINIKNHTWDAEGKYIINTLQATFNALKVHDVKLICDLKNGTNAEVAQIAALCGVTDRILLSYKSPSNALNEVAFLKKYDNVPIRVIPTSYQEMINLSEEIANPIYCDVNAYMPYYASNCLPIALACGFPILFSGCTLNNKNVWAVVANGCMANEDLNISYRELAEVLRNDYSNVSEISISQDSIEANYGETVSITASNSLKETSGNIYVYSQDNAICKVVQNTFGNSINFDVETVATGETKIVVFDGVGNVIYLPVNITVATVPEPELGKVGNMEYIIGASISGTDMKVYENDSRMVAVATSGKVPAINGDNAWVGTKYAIEIPVDATKIVITSPGHIAGIMFCTADEEGVYAKALDSGWQTANQSTYEFEAGAYNCLFINYKNLANSAIASNVDLSGFSIVFE